MVNISEFFFRTGDNKTDVFEMPLCLYDLHNQKSVQMCLQRWLLFGGSKDSDDAHVGTFSTVSV